MYDKEILKQINERWENGELTYEELMNDYLWLKDRCNKLLVD